MDGKSERSPVLDPEVFGRHRDGRALAEVVDKGTASRCAGGYQGGATGEDRWDGFGGKDGPGRQYSLSNQFAAGGLLILQSAWSNVTAHVGVLCSATRFFGTITGLTRSPVLSPPITAF